MKTRKEQLEHAALLAFFKDAGLVATSEPTPLRGNNLPDLRCTIGGEQVAFEVTKLTDESLENMVNASMSWQRKLNRTLDGLPLQLQHDLATHIAGCQVHVDMQWPVRPEKLAADTELLAKFLLTITPTSTRKRYRPRIDTFPTVDVQHCAISRPAFLVAPAGGWVGTSLAETLEKKIRKKYAITCPIELLIYSDGFTPPDPNWLDEARDLLELRIGKSPFRRIWIHDAPRVVKVAV
jgi:hypothetical protein